MKVSVIVPYYRKSLNFENTLNSILKQTFFDLEIILIFDDDNDYEFKKFINILNKFDQKKIFVYKNIKNLGVSYSRNKGISLSRGDYIAFIDADDIWKFNKVQNQLNFMIKNDLDFSYTAYTKEFNYSVKKTVFYPKLNYKKMLKSCFIGLSTVMISKTLKNEIKFPNIKTKEDYIVWLRLLRNRDYIYGLNQELTVWKKSKNSLSSNLMNNFKDVFLVFYKYEGFAFFKSLFFTLRLTVFFLIKNIWK